MLSLKNQAITMGIFMLNSSTVEPGDSKPVDSKQPGVSKLFTIYQPIYNINLQIDSKLLPILKKSRTWR